MRTITQRATKEIPKGNAQKASEDKDGSSAGDQGNGQDGSFKQYQNLITPLLFIGFVLSSIFRNAREQKQGSFQESKTKLLEPGHVDHIVVSNKSILKDYVKGSSSGANAAAQGPVGGPSSRSDGSQYKYYFTIGNIDSFEDKLEAAQQALGIDPHNYIPVTYAHEMKLLKFGPTLLILAALFYMGWRVQSGLGGGPAGKESCGIFNIGKAHVTKMVKNSKNKVICWFRFTLKT